MVPQTEKIPPPPKREKVVPFSLCILVQGIALTPVCFLIPKYPQETKVMLSPDKVNVSHPCGNDLRNLWALKPVFGSNREVGGMYSVLSSRNFLQLVFHPWHSWGMGSGERFLFKDLQSSLASLRQWRLATIDDSADSFPCTVLRNADRAGFNGQANTAWGPRQVRGDHSNFQIVCLPVGPVQSPFSDTV